MWWKIYFWLAICEAILAVASIFAIPGDYIVTQIVMTIIFLVGVVGLYSYIFQKKLLTEVFWQYFLGIYILIDIFLLLYTAFPHAPIISSLAFLTVYKDSSFLESAIGAALDIPLLYAIYRLTKGEIHTQKEKKKNKHLPHRWGMIQTAFWGYASVLVFFLLIIAFVPSGNNDVSKQQSSDPYFVASIFAPVLLFWLGIIMRYKEYRWNWWKTTLAANGILYSGTIIIGVFFPQTVQAQTSGIDVIGLLQILIMFIGLWVFGREQFIKTEASKEEK